MKTVVAFRTFDEDKMATGQEIHSPSTGLEVYAGQPINAEISFQDKENFKELPVFRISPIGVEIDITSITTLPDSLETGSEVSVTVRIGKQLCPFDGLIVSSFYTLNSKKIIGVRWVSNLKSAPIDKDRRSAPRWLSGEAFMPTGIAPNPARFNDFIYFKIADISKDGLQITTSLRNKLLIPGMILDSTVSFPLVGQVHLQFKILNVRTKSIEGKDTLSLGVKVLNHDKPSLETMGQYLLQFGPPVTIKELKKHGMGIQSAETGLEFGFVKTKEDYIDVLKLRKSAYSQVGKFDDDKDFEGMGDSFDAKSRIITVRHKGNLVGSARVAFHTEEDFTEYEEFVTLPKDFPRKTDMIVGSRVCTHPDYRGSDLVYALIKQVCLIAVQSNRKYILGGSSESLYPFYHKLGFRGTGLFFEHGGLNKVKEEVILGDATKILLGEGCSLSVWTRYFYDLSEYITNYHDLDISPKTRVRLWYFNFFGKILSLFKRSIH